MRCLLSFRSGEDPFRSSGLSRDQVELVPLDVAECAPLLEFADLDGAEEREPGRVRGEVVADDVEVQPVLDGLGFRDGVEGDLRAAGRGSDQTWVSVESDSAMGQPVASLQKAAALRASWLSIVTAYQEMMAMRVSLSGSGSGFEVCGWSGSPGK